VATTIVTSYFATNGSPTLGASPTVKIWEVPASGPNVLVINAVAMSEVGDGFYKYVFTTFDASKDYVILSNKGVGPAKEQFSIGSIGDIEINLDAADLSGIASAVWEEQASAHVNADTMGLLQNTTAADTAAVKIDMTTAISLVTTLLKYQTNRTRIDKTLKTLTIYQDNGTSILQVFDLKDSGGVLSVTEVCERDPQ